MIPSIFLILRRTISSSLLKRQRTILMASVSNASLKGVGIIYAVEPRRERSCLLKSCWILFFIRCLMLWILEMMGVYIITDKRNWTVAPRWCERGMHWDFAYRR